MESDLLQPEDVRVSEASRSEANRLKTLQRYGILDTPSEDIFDCITAAVTAVCETPIGVITLIDSERLWFLSRIGLDMTEAPRENSFCSFAAARPGEVTEIPDALKDIRFKTNPLVTDYPKIRFYAGIPLSTTSGYELGTLSVFDYLPGRLTELQRSSLKQLARLIMLLLDHRASSPVSVIGRAVQDTLPNGVVIADPNLPGYPITFCNEGFEKLTGYGVHEVVGKDCLFLQGLEGDREKVEEIRDAISSKRSITSVLKNYKKDGTAFWNELTLSPVKDGAGNLSHYLGFQNDVTARVHALEKLETSHEGLRKLVESHAETGDALAVANDALVQEISQRKKIEQQSLKLQGELIHIARLSTMGEMATGLAHELNQPLLAISQCADTAMLVAKENADRDPELMECIEDIQTQTQRAGEIIRALRQFISRDTSKRSAVDINELVHQAIRLTKSDSRALNVDIEFIEGTLPKPFIDRVQIAQVLVNLLRNSIDAITSIESDHNQQVHNTINVRTNFSDDEIMICVTDSGPGFDPDIEPFKAFESSKQDGLGIGLSISRSIIESHDGRLWIKKNSGHGCSMCISIPMVPVAGEYTRRKGIREFLVTKGFMKST